MWDAGIDAEVELIGVGGYACVFKSQYGQRKTWYATRISVYDDAQSIKIVEHQNLLAQQFPDTVLRVEAHTVLDEVPEIYMSVLLRMPAGQALLARWPTSTKYLLTRTRYLANGSLAEYMETKTKRFSIEAISGMAVQLYTFFYMAQAIYGFEHSDLTAQNILIDDDGKTVKLIDFDAMRFNAFHVADRRFYSLYTLPPERLYAAGNLTWHLVPGAIDVWSVGITLLGAFLGHPLLVNNHGHPQNEASLLPILQHIIMIISALGNGVPVKHIDRLPSVTPDRVGSMMHYCGLIAKDLPPDGAKFFRRVLHWLPNHRTYNGDMHLLFTEHHEFLARSGMITGHINHFFKMKGYDTPPTLSVDPLVHIEQIQRLIGDGFFDGVHCSVCGATDATQYYMAKDSNCAVVCSEQCATASASSASAKPMLKEALELPPAPQFVQSQLPMLVSQRDDQSLLQWPRKSLHLRVNQKEQYE